MDTRFKLKISKLFTSSFTSCRSKHISDVADRLFSPKPKTSDHTLSPELTLTGKPPSNPLPPPQSHPKKPKTTKKHKPHHRKTTKIHNFSSITDNLYYDCCSSDEDDEIDDQTTLFSSRSLSSDSSVSHSKNRARRRRRKNNNGCKGLKATDVIPVEAKGKLMKDSVAIVKKSSDPHEDFRVSMLEMIVERQIFGAKDLENLLQCFLSLNCEEHHEVICEVFTEIWETLFSDWL